MVQESLVIERAGKVVALVYPKPGVVPSEDHIRDYTNRSLPIFSQIFRVELVDLPFQRTAKGTIKRHLYQ